MVGAVTGNAFGGARRAAGVPSRSGGSHGALIMTMLILPAQNGLVTAPPGATWLEVLTIGGASGAYTRAGNVFAGGVGGAGATAYSSLPITSQQTFSVIAGAVGADGDQTASQTPGNGGASSVTSGGIVLAFANGGIGVTGPGMGGSAIGCIGNIAVVAGNGTAPGNGPLGYPLLSSIYGTGGTTSSSGAAPSRSGAVLLMFSTR